MKIKTSELEGAGLNYCVDYIVTGKWPDTCDDGHVHAPDYQSDWSQGGPLIERYLITATPHTWDEGPTLRCCWVAVSAIYGVFDGPKSHLEKRHYGPTPLIAAFRALVAAKLGDEVEVPEELV